MYPSIERDKSQMPKKHMIPKMTRKNPATILFVNVSAADMTFLYLIISQEKYDQN